jgi:hypothetical protein
MNDDKTSISRAQSPQEIGEYWDTHDLGEVWDQTSSAEFAVAIHSEKAYYPVESSLSDKLHLIARRRGVSAETLLNLWLQEKVNEAA